MTHFPQDTSDPAIIRRPSETTDQYHSRMVASTRQARLAAPAGDLVPGIEALRALKLHVAYEAVPADRGGKNGPKGKAWQAFIDARDAALRTGAPS